MLMKMQGAARVGSCLLLAICASRLDRVMQKVGEPRATSTAQIIIVYPLVSFVSHNGPASYDGSGGIKANLFPSTVVMQHTPGGQQIMANPLRHP